MYNFKIFNSSNFFTKLYVENFVPWLEFVCRAFNYEIQEVRMWAYCSQEYFLYKSPTYLGKMHSLVGFNYFLNEKFGELHVLGLFLYSKYNLLLMLLMSFLLLITIVVSISVCSTRNVFFVDKAEVANNVLLIDKSKVPDIFNTTAAYGIQPVKNINFFFANFFLTKFLKYLAVKQVVVGAYSLFKGKSCFYIACLTAQIVGIVVGLVVSLPLVFAFFQSFDIWVIAELAWESFTINGTWYGDDADKLGSLFDNWMFSIWTAVYELVTNMDALAHIDHAPCAKDYILENFLKVKAEVPNKALTQLQDMDVSSVLEEKKSAKEKPEVVSMEIGIFMLTSMIIIFLSQLF